MVKNRKSMGTLAKIIANRSLESLKRTEKRMDLAVKIYEAMKAKGLNQKQFAEMMGKSEPEISDWLSGQRNFTVDLLTDIELALNIRLIDTSIISVYTVSYELIHYKESNKEEVFQTDKLLPLNKCDQSFSNKPLHCKAI